jgi:hypothetical protein
MVKGRLFPSQCPTERLGAGLASNHQMAFLSLISAMGPLAGETMVLLVDDLFNHPC